MKNKILFLILIMSIIILPFNSKALNKYEIVNDDIDLKVEENGMISVKETIFINFNKKTDYIIKKISLEDGKIYDLKCNIEYKKSVDNNYIVLKISNKDAFYGKQRIEIKYKYKLKYLSNFNYNLINNSFDYSIDNVGFNIAMPKEIKKDNINFSGYNKKNITYSVNDNKIFGGLIGSLDKNKSVNINIKLDDKYFGSNNNNKNMNLLIFLLILLFISVSTVIYKYGNPKK